MFNGLREGLKQGQTIKGTLQFEKAGSIEVEISGDANRCQRSRNERTYAHAALEIGRFNSVYRAYGAPRSSSSGHAIETLPANIYLHDLIEGTGKGETMLSQGLIVAPTQSRPPALIEGREDGVNLGQFQGERCCRDIRPD
jgi:hypothetical protein